LPPKCSFGEGKERVGHIVLLKKGRSKDKITNERRMYKHSAEWKCWWGVFFITFENADTRGRPDKMGEISRKGRKDAGKYTTWG